MKTLLVKLLFPILVLLLCFWAIKPLLSISFYPMHDDTQPARVYQMAKALSYMQFPVRWVPDLGYGYGYPLFNFYAPFPYYVGGLFYLLGVNLLESTKIMIIIGIILSGLTMYFLIKEFSNNIGALVCAVLYVYTPYHAVNIYIRGAIGELYAYAFLPMIFLGVLIIIKSIRNNNNPRDKRINRGIIIGSIGIGGLLLSHNILGMISLFFLGLFIISSLIYLFVIKQKLTVIYYLLLTISLGVGLSSFFVLPAMVEKKYTKVEEITTGGSSFQKNFVYLDQLWDSPWGYGGSISGRDDGMSFKIGKFHLILGSLSLIALIFLSKQKKISKLYLLFYSSQLIIFATSIFFMLSSSNFLWEKIPGFIYIQYPWRFLNFTLISLVIITSIIYLLFSKLYRVIIALFIIGITLLINIKYFIPQKYLNKTEADYISDKIIRYNISRISDEYLPENFLRPENQTEIVFQGVSANDNIKIVSIKEDPIHKRYQMIIENPVFFQTNIAYFPGWVAKLDQKQIDIIDINGKIGLYTPSGSHLLELNLKDTPIRSVGNTISVFSIFLIVYISLFGWNVFYGKKNIN